jgi:predicted helicase
MQRLELKPTHKPVQNYYAALRQFDDLGVTHETAVRSAFQALLDHCARQHDWTLVPEWEIRRPRQHPLRVDGALLDNFRLTHGFWEAKDSRDDLPKEARKKFALGYPRDNILFQTPRRALLFQNDTLAFDADLTQPQALIDALHAFFGYTPPAYTEWERAVSEFRDRVPELARSLIEIIEKERKANRRFIQAFADFAQLARRCINPNLADAAVEEMLIQHLLTERLFRTIFNNPDFTRRNIIAAEIEKVIDALASQSFSRADFLKKLDRFYLAMEQAAATISDFSQKQQFLNTVYEKFFQGFCVKVADTHGIVYTPPSIVRFMIRSVAWILESVFGKALGSKGVHFLDPFVGTGNFVVHLMDEIPRTALPHKFAHELHANEIMLLPYYIASMNIEHAYFEATGQYEPFAGICLVDTFETAEVKTGSDQGVRQQVGLEFFNHENIIRVNRQKQTPIFVVQGNPPYNTNQADENDNNKNRKYPAIDGRIAATYAADSKATLRNKLSDPYIKAIRWASDRIGQEGIVALVTNSGFLDAIACDGMRKNLAEDFDAIYVLDLGGNVRKNPKLSGTTHNVFGIQVGVSINLLVRNRTGQSGKPDKPAIYYAAVPTDWRREEKYRFLEDKASARNIEWQRIQPDAKHTWLREGLDDDFDALMPLGTKLAKQMEVGGEGAIFKTYSLGVSTNRDSVVYDFNREALAKRVEQFCDDYNAELARYDSKGKPENRDEFLSYEKVKWSRNLKRAVKQGIKLQFEGEQIRCAAYRPFTKEFLYFAETIVDEEGTVRSFYPTERQAKDNVTLCATGSGSEKPFMSLATTGITDLHFVGPGAGTVCFPFYTYGEDGSERRENITDWALQQFQARYSDPKISKWDIFHYVYAVLHHPQYRERYAANLRRELPRIPFVAAEVTRLTSKPGAKAASEDGASSRRLLQDAEVFHAFAAAGKKLAEMHVAYEQQPEFPLRRRENPQSPLNWRVEKMRLSKEKSSLTYNDFLTLDGIPPETFEYRLGNRSALEWVIDQYQVSTDKRSGITNDPNRPDDPEYIVRLLGQVVTVSLETQKVVKELSPLTPEGADGES